MPYPNFHAARMVDPGKFDPESFRYVKLKGTMVETIMGKLKGESAMSVQAYRFPKEEYTPAEAKAWLKEQGLKPISFEPADETMSEDEIEKVLVGACASQDTTALREIEQKYRDGCGQKKTDTVNRIDTTLKGPDWMVKPFTKTAEGYLVGRAIVSNVGVFTYQNPDGSVRRELRLPEEVFARDSIESLVMQPVTNNHPREPVTADNVKKLSVGTTGGAPSIPPVDIWDGRFMEGDWAQDRWPNGKAPKSDYYHLSIEMKIMDPKAVADVEAGKTALSCGYECRLENKSGTWMGMAYDAIQRDIRYNHVAIVDVARAGDAARIVLDSADAVSVGQIIPFREEVPTMPELKKITLDGVEYQAEAKILEVLHQAKEDGSRKDAELVAKSDALSAAEAERDSLKARVDALTAENETLKTAAPARIDEAVKARFALVSQAAKAGVEVKGDESDLDLKKAVILKAFADTKFDGKDEVYIAHRFDFAVEELERRAGNSQRNADSVTQGQDKPAAPSVDKARQDYAEYLRNLHRGKKED